LGLKQISFRDKALKEFLPISLLRSFTVGLARDSICNASRSLIHAFSKFTVLVSESKNPGTLAYVCHDVDVKAGQLVLLAAKMEHVEGSVIEGM